MLVQHHRSGRLSRDMCLMQKASADGMWCQHCEAWKVTALWKVQQQTAAINIQQDTPQDDQGWQHWLWPRSATRCTAHGTHTAPQPDFLPCTIMPHSVGALSVDGHCLSVNLSVPCLTLRRAQEAENLQKGSPQHRWSVAPFRGQKIKGQGH